MLQIAYWELISSSTPIREVDGAVAGNINGMDIANAPYGTTSGHLNNYAFVTCGGDKLVKVMQAPQVYLLQIFGFKFFRLEARSPSQDCLKFLQATWKHAGYFFHKTWKIQGACMEQFGRITMQLQLIQLN